MRTPMLSVASVFLAGAVVVTGSAEEAVQTNGQLRSWAALERAKTLRLLAGKSGSTEFVSDAVSLLNQVADDNSTQVLVREANFELAEIYEYAEITPPAANSAQNHYLKAAALGSSDALFKLAVLDPLQAATDLSPIRIPSTLTADTYADSDLLQSRSAVQQLSQLKQAAVALNADAAVALAYRYKFGFDVAANCSMAAALYELAVNDGMSQFLSSNYLESEFPRHDVNMRRKSKRVSRNSGTYASLVHDYYQYSAASGNAESQYLLGKLLYSTAIEQLESASQGDPELASLLAEQYVSEDEQLSPFGDARANLEQAHELFVAAAEAGSAEAYTGLGHMYYQGTPVVRRNVSAAKEYFSKSAKMGYPGGLNGLGIMYFEGIDRSVTSKKFGKALTYFAKAAEHHFVPALYNAGVFYLHGSPRSDPNFSASRDFKKALQMFSQAAKHGHVRSLVALAHMHLHGLGTLPSCSSATTYFKIAAESFFVDDKVQAAVNTPQSSDAKVFRKGILLANEASQQGSSIAQVHLATLYKDHCRLVLDALETEHPANGDSSTDGFQSPGAMDDSTAAIVGMVAEVAARWLDSVSSLVNALRGERAMDNSAAVQTLELHPFCSSRAIDLLQQAADQDDHSANLYLGDILYYTATGGVIGGPFNSRPETSDAIDRLELAAYYYRQAATVDRSAQAMFNIGFMHQYGIGLRKDFHLAERYYDMAAATNSNAFAPSQVALMALQVHRIVDGEALPEYLMLIDSESVMAYVVFSTIFVIFTFLWGQR